MNPVAFHLGSRPVYWYGILMALAFTSAMTHWYFVGKKEDRPKGFWSDMAFWIMVGGIIGARIGYILGNLGYFIENPLSVFRIDEGGLVFYGGLIGCVLVVIVLAMRQREPVWSMADFAVAPLPLGHAFGRVGCFLNGCCYGSETACAVGVEMQGAVRHPVQLYEAILNFILYFLLLVVYRRKRRDGEVLMAYCLIYPLLRFLIEFMRGDDRWRMLNLTSAQLVSLALLVCGILLWKLLPKKLFRSGKR